MTIADAKLVCRSVWKLFGAGAERYLAAAPETSDDALKRAGLIGAVRDVSLDGFLDRILFRN